MPVPKRRTRHSRTLRQRGKKELEKGKNILGVVKSVVKTKDKRGYKRPHVDEYKEI